MIPSQHGASDLFNLSFIIYRSNFLKGILTLGMGGAGLRAGSGMLPADLLRNYTHVCVFVFVCFFLFSLQVRWCYMITNMLLSKLCLFGLIFRGLCYPTTAHAGYNARYFHGFQPEDFIGKMAVVCQAANNSRVEHVALARFYLGYLKHALWKVCFITTVLRCFKLNLHKSHFLVWPTNSGKRASLP